MIRRFLNPANTLLLVSVLLPLLSAPALADSVRQTEVG
jgi:hypothetical protein